MKLIFDKFDSQVTEFREKIYKEDLQISIDIMNLERDEIFEILKDRSLNVKEDAWKFSNTMWKKANIDMVCLKPNVGISCGQVKDRYTYRGAYLTYTLKKQRVKHRSLNFKEFGFLTHQCIRAAQIGCRECIITVYEYDKKMSAQVRALKHKGYADLAGNILHQELEYKGVQDINYVDQHVFSIDFEKLFKKYDPYLLEMKNEETLPVQARYPTQPEKYPYVVDLGIDVDVKTLQKEFDEFDKNDNYMLKRMKDFVLSPSINLILMNYLGFRDEVYQGVSLNKPGSLELKDNVGIETKKFLKQFDNICRINYITTYKGWKTKPHKDHEDYTTQGFRIIVPFAEMKMTFENKMVYIFQPGRAYFVNVAVEHVGEHFSELDKRTGILFKLAKDDLIWKNM